MTAAALVLLFLSAPRQEPPVVDLRSLLLEMTDRDRIARWPRPEFRCLQASSYDRDSTSPEDPGWFANWDRSHFLRVDERAGRREYVLMEDDGPGAVVRFWATWHGPGGGPFTNGTLRFYFDGEERPEIEGPLADLISGGALVGPPFSESVSPQTEYARRGHSLYLPIPYARGCRITYETEAPIDPGAHEGEALYYQIDYRSYPPGTAVRTFRRADLERLAPWLQRVGGRLQTPVAPGDFEPLHGVDLTTPFAGRLEPGAAGPPVAIAGPQAIRFLALRVAAEDLGQALRSTVLEIAFDGERTVWCPLGALFGCGPGPREQTTWWTRTAWIDDSFWLFAAWPMPFAERAELLLRNLGSQPVALAGRALVGPWHWDRDSLFFHAAWRQWSALATGGRKGMEGAGAFDLEWLAVEGKGVYAGDTLSLFNAAGAWWGEGDEKIRVDGEPFPSHFGTGSEDYFGYAWCRPEPFATPFHAQPDGSGNLRPGATTNLRYRILDTIPFRRSLSFTMELWHWADTRIDYAPATFFYARPGARWRPAPQPEEAARPLSRRRSDLVEVFAVPGAIEGEEMEVLERGGGRVQVQDSGTFGWSEEAQLWWIDGAPGDRLVLGFDAPETGRRRVRARLTRADDYGIVELKLNGRSAGRFDRFHPTVETTTEELGEFELRRRGNRLEVVLLGRNEAARPRFMFGLDALVLEPAEGAEEDRDPNR